MSWRQLRRMCLRGWNRDRYDRPAFVAGPLSDCLDFRGDGGRGAAGLAGAWFRPGAGRVVGRRDERADCHWPDRDDVPTAGEGALREAAAGVPQLAHPGSVPAAELADWPSADVSSEGRRGGKEG